MIYHHKKCEDFENCAGECWSIATTELHADPPEYVPGDVVNVPNTNSMQCNVCGTVIPFGWFHSCDPTYERLKEVEKDRDSLAQKLAVSQHRVIELEEAIKEWEIDQQIWSDCDQIRINDMKELKQKIAEQADRIAVLEGLITELLDTSHPEETERVEQKMQDALGRK